MSPNRRVVWDGVVFGNTVRIVSITDPRTPGDPPTFTVETQTFDAMGVGRWTDLRAVNGDGDLSDIWEGAVGSALHDSDTALVKNALEDAMRVLPGDAIFARRPDGTPITAEEMVTSLRSYDDLAKQFCADVVGAAVRAVRVAAAPRPIPPITPALLE